MFRNFVKNRIRKKISAFEGIDGWLTPKLPPGGFIAFHDYYADRTDLGSTFVVDNMVLPSANFRFYRSFDTLWTARKIH